MRDGRGRGNLHTWAPRSEVASWASRSRLARAIGQASGWGLRWGLWRRLLRGLAAVHVTPFPKQRPQVQGGGEDHGVGCLPLAPWRCALGCFREVGHDSCSRPERGGTSERQTQKATA